MLLLGRRSIWQLWNARIIGYIPKLSHRSQRQPWSYLSFFPTPILPWLPHALIWVPLARIMLKACDLLAILLSVHHWRLHQKPTTCLVFINMSFEASRGIFIVWNMNRAPIILVQIKVVLKICFLYWTLWKGPWPSTWGVHHLKKKRIRFHSKPWKPERREINLAKSIKIYL